MKQFLLGAAVATAVLGAAGFAVLKEPVADAAVKKTMPLKLSDLTLDRAFRYTLSSVSTTPSMPTTLTAPADQGFVFTDLAPGTFGGTIQYVAISINNAPYEWIPIGRPAHPQYVSVPNGANLPAPLMPPIILRPGDTMSFYGTPDVTIGGYFVYPGEV